MQFINRKQLVLAIYNLAIYISQRQVGYLSAISRTSSLRFINCKQTAFAIYKVQIRYLRLINRVSVNCGPDGGGWRMADGGWKNADDKMLMTKC